MTSVLALDLATVCGWAGDGPDPGRPVGGTFKCPSSDDDLGEAYHALRMSMKRLILAYKPDRIILEAPLPVTSQGHINTGHKDSARTVRKLLGFVAVAEGMAWEAGIDCCEENVQTVRKYFTGSAHSGVPGDPKAGVMGRLRQLGWTVVDDNHGDAVALWTYQKALLDRNWSPNMKAGPLFA